jgi:hypothetical protein
MKQVRYLIFLIFLIPVQGFSQLFTGGLELGLAGSQVAGDTYAGYNKAGLAGGGWINLKIDNYQSVQFEMMYLQKGSRHNPNYKIQDYTSYLMQLGYVELPLSYNLDLGNNIILSAGPSLGILAHSRELLDEMPQFGNNFNRIDVSVNAGVGYRMSEKMIVSLRTINSILPIKQDAEAIDRWRIFSYGKFNDLLLIGIYRKF